MSFPVDLLCEYRYIHSKPPYDSLMGHLLIFFSLLTMLIPPLRMTSEQQEEEKTLLFHEVRLSWRGEQVLNW